MVIITKKKIQRGGTNKPSKRKTGPPTAPRKQPSIKVQESEKPTSLFGVTLKQVRRGNSGSVSTSRKPTKVETSAQPTTFKIHPLYGQMEIPEPQTATIKKGLSTKRQQLNVILAKRSEMNANQLANKLAKELKGKFPQSVSEQVSESESKPGKLSKDKIQGLSFKMLRPGNSHPSPVREREEGQNPAGKNLSSPKRAGIHPLILGGLFEARKSLKRTSTEPSSPSNSGVSSPKRPSSPSQSQTLLEELKVAQAAKAAKKLGSASPEILVQKDSNESEFGVLGNLMNLLIKEDSKNLKKRSNISHPSKKQKKEPPLEQTQQQLQTQPPQQLQQPQGMFFRKIGFGSQAPELKRLNRPVILSLTKNQSIKIGANPTTSSSSSKAVSLGNSLTTTVEA